MAMFRRGPKGIEFTVRIPDAAMRTEVQAELDELGISSKVIKEGGLTIVARGEGTPEQVRTILKSHGLRPPTPGPAPSAAGQAPGDDEDDEEDDEDGASED